MATQPVGRVSEDEYLRLERAAEYKSEYVDGEIFAMAGGSPRHARLQIKWGAQLELLLDASCKTFSSDLKIRTPGTASYVYPDISVVCGQPQIHGSSGDILSNPVVVIEILSPSTENYDRGKKFELYREIPSLQDYVLTHTDSAWVEHYHRQADASWIFREYRGLESAIPIPSINCTVRLTDLYAGVLE